MYWRHEPMVPNLFCSRPLLCNLSSRTIDLLIIQFKKIHSWHHGEILILYFGSSYWSDSGSANVASTDNKMSLTRAIM